MPDVILDGAGSGNKAKVDGDLRLYTYAKSASIQHVVSENNQNAYQVIGTATLESGTCTVIHLTNTDSDNNCIITYLRHQVITAAGGTSFPNADNYFSVGLGRVYDSGGSVITPVNVFSGSGNTAKVTCYDSCPTLTAHSREIDRWYTKDLGDMNTFNKEGSLIIPPNKTIEISYTGDQTSGHIYARLSFIMGS